MQYEIHFVPGRNSFWNYVKGILGTEHKIFDVGGDWGKSLFFFSFFFSLGGKSLFLAADRGREGDRKWVRMLVVPFSGQKNQTPWLVRSGVFFAQ